MFVDKIQYFCNMLSRSARFFLLILFLLTSSAACLAQFVSWDSFVEMQAQNDEAGESSYWENFAEEAAFLHEHPININASTKSTLEQLPFLSPKQIEDILFYIDYYGALHSVGELQLISSLDYYTRQALSFFVVFGEKTAEPERLSFRNLLSKGKQTVLTRLSVPLYMRDGYQPFTLEQWQKAPSQHYWGNKLYHSLRYTYQYGQHLFVGFSAEKDAGEPFFTRGYNEMLGTRGYDFYSGYVQVKDLVWLDNLTLGCYRLSFGQGLVVNNNFSLGKNAALSGVERAATADPIHKHGGTNETDYLRGIASTVSFGPFAITGFFSYRRYDATMKGDSISTLLSTGLHRTSLEMSRDGNVKGVLGGGHLKYSWNGLHAGLTALVQQFDHSLSVGTSDYKKFSPQGNRFVNVGADYALFRHAFSLSGETALSSNGGWATLNSLRVEPLERVYLTLLQRHFSADYWGLQANSFSEGSEVRNESGIYLGADVERFYRWHFSAYADLFRFPEVKYRVSQPSKGADLQASVSYSPNDKWTFLSRYRCKIKERDVETAYRDVWNGELFRVVTQRIRFQSDALFSDEWEARASADYCQVNAETVERGVRAAMRATYMPQLNAKMADKLRLNAECSWFRTTDYSARIYGYERGLLYSYGYRSFYGHGVRGTFMADVTFRQRLTCSIWGALTYYFDREEIGSGAERIPQNHAEDVALQVRYKF